MSLLVQAGKGAEASEKLAAAANGASMEEDRLSQISELTGLELSGLAGSACCSDDDGSAAAMSASYASSLASEAAKQSRPATPEAVWPGALLFTFCLFQ